MHRMHQRHQRAKLSRKIDVKARNTTVATLGQTVTRLFHIRLRTLCRNVYFATDRDRCAGMECTEWLKITWMSEVHFVILRESNWSCFYFIHILTRFLFLCEQFYFWFYSENLWLVKSTIIFLDKIVIIGCKVFLIKILMRELSINRLYMINRDKVMIAYK